MYRSNGNYEAFARPRKPEGADDKTVWLVGGGLAASVGSSGVAERNLNRITVGTALVWFVVIVLLGLIQRVSL